MKRFIIRHCWILLGLLALLAKVILRHYPETVEWAYSRGLFLSIRWLFDIVLYPLPIPLIYLLIPLCLLYLGIRLKRIWQTKPNWRARLGKSIHGILSLLGGALFLFLFLWGFNYDRVPVERQLALKMSPLDADALREELARETELLLERRQGVPGAGDSALIESVLPAQLENKVRERVEDWLARNGFPTTGRVRGRKIYPSGIFIRFSSAGLYFPYTGEGHYDAGLHPLDWPPVLAHELAHGYGFGGEGTCSFIAYVALSQSDDPVLAYTAHLDHWQTLAAQLRRIDPEGYMVFRGKLSRGIRADLRAIYEKLDEYPRFFPKLRYRAYDAYLKAQGIEEGYANYNRVVMLVYAWRKALKM